MFEEQKQDVGQGGIGYQSKGQMIVNHYQGTSVELISDVAQGVFTRNFAALSEQASFTAMENIKKFLDELNQRVDKLEDLDLAKLKDPDVQFSISEATFSAGRKGDSVTIDSLGELICQRLRSSNSIFFDILLSQAISLVPKISPDHLKLIGFATYFEIASPKDPTSGIHLEEYADLFIGTFGPGLNVRRIEQEYLSSMGLMDLNLIDPGNAKEIFVKSQAPFLKTLNKTQIEEYLKKEAPRFNAFVDWMYKSDITPFRPTAIGYLIGFVFLKPIGVSDDFRKNFG